MNDEPASPAARGNTAVKLGTTLIFFWSSTLCCAVICGCSVLNQSEKDFSARKYYTLKCLREALDSDVDHRRDLPAKIAAVENLTFQNAMTPKMCSGAIIKNLNGDGGYLICMFWVQNQPIGKPYMIRSNCGKCTVRLDISDAERRELAKEARSSVLFYTSTAISGANQDIATCFSEGATAYFVGEDSALISMELIDCAKSPNKFDIRPGEK